MGDCSQHLGQVLANPRTRNVNPSNSLAHTMIGEDHMLPRSVQTQADAATELQDQLNQSAEVENPATQATLNSEQDQESVKPEAQPAIEQQTETRDTAYWRHRFDVLQGKYNSEVPALRKEIATITEQLASADKQKSGTAVEQAHSAVSDLTQDEIEEYGPDLVKFIQRVATGASKGSGGDLSEIKGELDQMREEKRQDAEARFWSDLEAQVPTFREINANQAFHQWLAQVDRLSGQTRQQLLVDAQHAFDPYRVAAVFKSFAADAPKVSQETIPDDSIQPRQARASAPELQQGKTWSRAEIQEFYRNKASYSKEQAASLEADIFAAQAQGRIQ